MLVILWRGWFYEHGSYATHHTLWHREFVAKVWWGGRLTQVHNEPQWKVWQPGSTSSSLDWWNVCIFPTQHHNCTSPWDQTFSNHLLSLANLKNYTNAAYKICAPLQGIWDFINCTIQPMCWPSQHQHQAYNSHKCFHGLKYQPSHFFDLIEGCHNDAFDDSPIAAGPGGRLGMFVI